MSAAGEAKDRTLDRFVNGVEEVFDATTTSAQNIRQMILKKGQYLETEQMFPDNNETWPVIIPAEEFNQSFPGTKISIAFPDDGAWKRFHKQLQHFPMIVCAKVREGDKRIVRLKEGSAAGCHIVIVDDLVQSGGTLIECQRHTQPSSVTMSSGAGINVDMSSKKRSIGQREPLEALHNHCLSPPWPITSSRHIKSIEP